MRYVKAKKPYQYVENKRKGSPIDYIIKIQSNVDQVSIVFDMNKTQEGEVTRDFLCANLTRIFIDPCEIIDALLAIANKNYSLQFVVDLYLDAGVCATYQTTMKEMVFLLGPEYLSFSVFKELGFMKEALECPEFEFPLEELQQANIRPKSLLKTCATTVEKLYWERTLFWDKIKFLPQEVKDQVPSIICDTEEKLKARYENNEINKDLYNKFYP